MAKAILGVVKDTGQAGVTVLGNGENQAVVKADPVNRVAVVGQPQSQSMDKPIRQVVHQRRRIVVDNIRLVSFF